MPRVATLGNGRILVGLDHRAQVRDFYFPYVGLENHISGKYKHRLGVWSDGAVYWFDDESWHIETEIGSDTFGCLTTATNERIGIKLVIADTVYNEKDIFLRRLEIHNLEDRDREVKVFFGQEFHISESSWGDTGYYDPQHKAIIHYKGKRVFLANAVSNKRGFDDFSIGLFEIDGKEGSYLDATDGKLSQNPIEHGSVDSVIGHTIKLRSSKTKLPEVVWYWLLVGETLPEVVDLQVYILEKTPEHLMRTTSDYWRAWVHKRPFTFYGLSDPVIALFKKSLFTIRALADQHGSIIASGDSDMLHHGKDTYSYMWPRDAAQAAIALDKAGDFTVTQKFFEFINEVLTDEGYLLHKYRPDRSLGSSWHPWFREGKMALPIQEDETSLVLRALWQHYDLTRDLEFVEKLYNPCIEKAADFLLSYTDPNTGLPLPSYDLWEEKYGVMTFTASARYSALHSAAQFAELLGKSDKAHSYSAAAIKTRDAIVKHLYDPDRKMFDKSIYFKEGGEIVRDHTLDMSSFYGIFKFGVLPLSDERVRASIDTIRDELVLGEGTIGGVPRYRGDRYYAVGPDASENPWFITTLWLAQYYIARATSEADMKPVRELLAWCVQYAEPSGAMSEQVNPYTGKSLSATPLAWSHSEYVITVIEYLERLEDLGICEACYPLS
jgi:oligosaccharide amylase